MKPIISIVAIAGLFSMTACNNAALQEKETALRIQQQQIDMMNMELAKKRVIDSMNEVTRTQYILPQAQTIAGVQYAAVKTPQVIKVQHYYTPRTSNSRSAYVQSSRSYSGYSQPVAYQPAPVQRKRGWSAKAKGAVIGGAGGAIAGAIINGRNRPVGALIGGVLGAGAGTGIGAIIDGRNGR